MTLPLLQRAWAAAEEERAQALRLLQREHQVCGVFCDCVLSGVIGRFGTID